MEYERVKEDQTSHLIIDLDNNEEEILNNRQPIVESPPNKWVSYFRQKEAFVKAGEFFQIEKYSQANEYLTYYAGDYMIKVYLKKTKDQETELSTIYTTLSNLQQKQWAKVVTICDFLRGTVYFRDYQYYNGSWNSITTKFHADVLITVKTPPIRDIPDSQLYHILAWLKENDDIKKYLQKENFSIAEHDMQDVVVLTDCYEKTRTTHAALVELKNWCTDRSEYMRGELARLIDGECLSELQIEEDYIVNRDAPTQNRRWEISTASVIRAQKGLTIPEDTDLLFGKSFTSIPDEESNQSSPLRKEDNPSSSSSFTPKSNTSDRRDPGALNLKMIPKIQDQIPDRIPQTAWPHRTKMFPTKSEYEKLPYEPTYSLVTIVDELIWELILLSPDMNDLKQHFTSLADDIFLVTMKLITTYEKQNGRRIDNTQLTGATFLIWVILIQIDMFRNDDKRDLDCPLATFQTLKEIRKHRLQSATLITENTLESIRKYIPAVDLDVLLWNLEGLSYRESDADLINMVSVKYVKEVRDFLDTLS